MKAGSFPHGCRALGVALLVFAAGCRIETAAPGSGAGVDRGALCATEPHGDLWVYTSMYRGVIDSLGPLLKAKLPKVTVHWYAAGSEKVLGRVDAERAAGAVRADVMATSDPFAFARLAQEGAFLPYASHHALRVPRSLVDLDARWVATRLSTMVMAWRKGLEAPPATFMELTTPKWKGRVAFGDPLVSGTAFTFAVFMEQAYGMDYFEKLRANGAVVAGGNSAVQQKVESGEADVGVLLLENVLMAKDRGSPLEWALPGDGAVVIPGPIAIFQTTRNPVAAKAFVDLILSREGQRRMVEGWMHAVDPRLEGPGGAGGLDALLARSRPWTEAVMKAGVEDGKALKDDFTRIFSR